MKTLQKHLRNSFPFLPIVLLLGFWFRLQGLINNTFAFTYDVGRDMLALEQIVHFHKFPLIGATTGLQGVFYGPTWYYFLAPFFILFRGDPRGILFVIVLSGVATGLIAYLFGKKVGEGNLGLFLATIISLSPILIGISSQIWNPNPIPFFIMSVLYIVDFASFNKKINLYILGAVFGVVLGIIFDLEIVFGSLFILGTILFLASSKIFIQKKIVLLVMTGGFLLVQLPRIVFEIRHSFLMTNKFLQGMVSPTQASLFTIHANFLRAFKSLFNLWNDTLMGQIPFLGAIAIIFTVYYLVRFYRNATIVEKNIVKHTALTVLVYFVGFSFLNHDIESHYYVGLPIVFIMLFSMAVYFASKYQKVRFIELFCIFIFLLANISRLNLIETFHKSTWKGDASVYRNQLEVVNYIYTDAKGQPFNYITYTPPIFDYPYQYIFLHTGKKVYGYLPDTKHQELFYLIIEPDLQIPQRQVDWLKLRKDDGKTVSEKTFGSGIRVEKRIH